MNKLKLLFHKDVLSFLLVHFLCTDVYGEMFFASLVLSPLLFIAIIFQYEEKMLTTLIVGGMFLVIVLIIFLRLYGLIYYYKKIYKRVSNPLVIKLFELLKMNKNHSRLIFLIIVNIVLIGLLVEKILDIFPHYCYFVRIYDQLCFLLFAGSFISYKILFTYFDVEKYKNGTNADIKSVFKFTFKHSYIFVLIYIILFILFYVLGCMPLYCQ